MIIEFGDIILDIPNWLIIIASFTFAFALTYIIIPSIITVSRVKQLFDNPDHRKSHTLAIPTLGGAAVFLGMVLPVILFGEVSFDHEFKYIIAGLLILFFIGIKDDILVISAKKKLVAEIFAISVIVILGDIRVTNFHGFLGINEIPYFVSIFCSLFVYIVVINGINLIDGIDGLASGVGIISISCFGVWFILIGDISYAAFCFSAVGALLAFFRFNVFSRHKKIFLGDTGSLVIGLVLSIFTINFLESSLLASAGAINYSAPAIAIGILIVPLIDTLRVFTIRLLIGKSPFRPDRFHIHHRLLRLCFTHLKSTLIILGFNLFIIILSLSLRHLGIGKLLLIIIPTAVLITSLPGFIIRYRERDILPQIELLGNKTWLLPLTFIRPNISPEGFEGRMMSLDNTKLPMNQPKYNKLEPVLIDTYELVELEEYPD